MGLKDAYLARVEAQIKEWDADFERMKAKADIASADAKIEYYNKLEGFKVRSEKLKEEYKTLKESSEEAFDEMKCGLEKACGELTSTFGDFKDSLTSALGKFQHKDSPST